MAKFKIGDRVQILNHEDVDEHLRNQTGIVTPSGGLEKRDDYVRVKLSKGSSRFIYERFLKKFSNEIGL